MESSSQYQDDRNKESTNNYIYENCDEQHERNVHLKSLPIYEHLDVTNQIVNSDQSNLYVALNITDRELILIPVTGKQLTAGHFSPTSDLSDQTVVTQTLDPSSLGSRETSQIHLDKDQIHVDQNQLHFERPTKKCEQTLESAPLPTVPFSITDTLFTRTSSMNDITKVSSRSRCILIGKIVALLFVLALVIAVAVIIKFVVLIKYNEYQGKLYSCNFRKNIILCRPIV